MLLLTFLLNALFFIQQPMNLIIDGYSNKLSAFPGDSIELYINSRNRAVNYPLRLFDLSGNEVGKVKMTVFPQAPSNDNPYENGFAYRVTKKIAVPKLPSGVYLWENQIPLIIKTHSAAITILYSSNTNNAYCNSGGKSLYGFNSTGNLGARKVSFLRPMSLPSHSEAFLRWIHKQPFTNVGYITDLDMDDYDNIKKSKLLIVNGHSEYWTLQSRKNLDRFVHSGKNAMILSGNTMWWQVRYNKTKDQLICFRDPVADPIKSAKLKTITWCEESLNYPILSSIGTDFRNAGYGLKVDKGWDGFKIVKSSPLLEGTNLAPGKIIPCPSDETDGIPILSIENEVPIINLEKVSFKNVEIIGYDLVSRGGKPGVATWIIFKVTDSSGTVINTGTTDWCSWRGIGSNTDIQRITLNMIHKLMNEQNVFSQDFTSNLAN